MNFQVVPLVPVPFHAIYSTNQENGFTGHGEYVSDSGRISGKTTAIGEYCFTRLMSQKGANVVVCRAEENDIRLTVFSFFQKCISKFKMEKFFKVTYSPFEVKFLPFGNRVIFMAINGDINRTKGFEFTREVDYIDCVWFEEINECDSPEFVDAARLTFLRFFQNCSKVFYVYNPPEGRMHWANSYFPDMYKRGLARRLYSTWEDIRGLLNQASIQKIEDDKVKDYDYYRYWYLGHIISLKGLVFKQFTRERNTVKNLDKEAIVSWISWLIISGDGAIKNDATCFGALAVLNTGAILVLDSYYYDPLVENAQLADTEQARRICKWFVNFFKKYPGIERKRIVGTVDNANYNLLCVLQGTEEMGYFKWIPATDKSILRDTHRLQNLFHEGLIIINDDPSTHNNHGIDEIESYVYDEKTQEIKKNQKDHYIDMLKYGSFIYSNPYAFSIMMERNK
ncbi:MAG: Phage terminase large subunit [Tenericutes bacterium ADurb.BinA124]|nr:MAG: Phage terminase large subunit [Tenericutes bacterium ADurb.BinA124]